MTTTELSSIYILCCLLMTGVAAKVILMACKPVLWSEIKMIKTPVNVAVYNGMHKGTQWLQGSDSRELSRDELYEAAKRINMHDELVKSLKDMAEIVGGNFSQNMEIKRKYKEARELLEKCK